MLHIGCCNDFGMTDEHYAVKQPASGGGQAAMGGDVGWVLFRSGLAGHAHALHKSHTHMDRIVQYITSGRSSLCPPWTHEQDSPL